MLFRSVTVTFGNKKIFFDPKDGKSVMSRTIDGVLEILKGRNDIKYKEGVITDYLNQARALVRRMESDVSDTVTSSIPITMSVAGYLSLPS